MLTASLLPAVLMGLIGSTHCIGMCGGIVSTLNTNFSGARQANPVLIQLFYNVGRITTYGLIGFLIGLFSSRMMELLPDPHAVAMKIAAVFFILLGLYVSQLVNSFRWLEAAGQRLWRHIEPFGRRYLPATSVLNAWKLGLIWGWLPCGLVYSALALAMTQTHPVHSALTMVAFGAGTLPTLMLIGHFASNVRTLLQQKPLRITLGILLIVYGLVQLLGVSTFHMHAH